MKKERAIIVMLIFLLLVSLNVSALAMDKKIQPPQVILHELSYPEEARADKLEGRVVLQLKISEEGVVLEGIIRNSSGYDILDRAAISSVEKWSFIPAQQDGKNIACSVLVPVDFVIGAPENGAVTTSDE